MKYLLKVTKTSKSSYYRFLKRDKNKDLELETKILLTHKKYKGIYGYRRIQVVLEKEFSMRVNHKKVQKVMKNLKIQSKTRKKRKFYSKEHNVSIIKPNILNREFTATQINQKWVTDITYLFFGRQKRYLSVIVDLYNKEIVSYHISSNNDNSLVFNTMRKAFKKLNKTEDLIVHSDQGAQYTSRQYVKMLSDFGLTQSMSRRGNCYDNAVCECFFSHLKSELIYVDNFRSLDHMILEIIKYLNFYNNKRIQINLNKMAPVEFRNHSIAI